MKIFASQGLNTINNVPKKLHKNKQALDNVQSSSIMKSSLQEAIGRSQVVSFGGQNIHNGNLFSHVCSENSGVTEKIFYNKDDGGFIHYVFSKDGNLTEKEEIYPNDKKEVYTSVKDNVTTIKTTSPLYNETIKKNNSGVEFYSDRTTFYKNGLKKSVFIKKLVNAYQEDIEKFDYSEETGRNTFHSLSKYYINNKGTASLVSEMHFVPCSSKIDKVYRYNDSKNGNSYEVIHYGSVNNVPKFSQRYTDGRLCEETSFYHDGKTRQHSRIYNNDDNSVKEIYYNNAGEMYYTKEFDADGFLYRTSEYSFSTVKQSKTVEFDKKTGIQYETVYDENTGNVRRVTKKSSQGEEIESVFLFKDGKNVQLRKKCNQDGSYIYIEYDKFGNKLKEQEFNADGTQKVSSSSNNSKSKKTDNNARKAPLQNELKFIEKILNSVTSQDYSQSQISDKEWQQFADYLGVEKDILFNMDKTSYRQLVKKYHPDMQSNGDEKTSDSVFKIINALYEKANPKN